MREPSVRPTVLVVDIDGPVNDERRVILAQDVVQASPDEL